MKELNFVENKKYIEDILNKCYIIEYNNSIYYVELHKNITRQLKYNKLLKNNRDIKIDKNKILLNDVILRNDLKEKKFYVNFPKIWIQFNHNIQNFNTDNYINSLLLDIFNIKYKRTQLFDEKYTTTYYSFFDFLENDSPIK